jgi:hypothetical protein
MTATRYWIWTLSCGYPRCAARYSGEPSVSLSAVRRDAESRGWTRYRAGLALHDRCPGHPRDDDAPKAERR